MFRILGGDGREYGPATAEQLLEWIAQNRANAQTQAKAEGTMEWKPLGQFPEFEAVFAARPATPPAINPLAPTAPSAEADPLGALRARVGRAYPLSIATCIGRGWDIMTSRFGLTVGATCVVMFCSIAISMIPLAGFIANLVLGKVFPAGLFFLFLRVGRDEPAEFSDAFAGFSRNFGQLVLLSIVTTLLIAFVIIACIIPAVFAIGPKAFSGLLSGGQPGPEILWLALLAPMLAIPAIYLTVSWTFAPLLVIDRGISFWDAMELSRKVVAQRWFRIFFLYLAFIPIFIAGFVCFIVGVFVATALFYGAVAVAYDTAFFSNADQPGA